MAQLIPFGVRFDGAVLAGEAGGFGLPVVFLHADVADRRMWAQQMAEAEAAGYHVIAYDRRGFGQTEAPDEPFDHLADLEAVLDQLSVHAAVLVGASAGGTLAIDFAVVHPERTIALVLAGTGISGADEPEVPEAAEPVFDALEYAEARGQVSTAARLRAQLWLDGPLCEAGRVGGPVRELFIEMNVAALARPRLTREEPRDPAIDNLARVSAPVLLIVGELDFPHIVDWHEMLAEAFEDAYAIVLAETAHLPGFERPDLFNPMLLEFLEAVTVGAGESPD